MPNKEDIIRNIKNAEEGRPLDMPLSILNGEMKKEWFKPIIKAKMKAYYEQNKDKIKTAWLKRKAISKLPISEKRARIEKKYEK